MGPQGPVVVVVDCGGGDAVEKGSWGEEGGGG